MLLACSVDTPIHINRSHLLASRCAWRPASCLDWALTVRVFLYTCLTRSPTKALFHTTQSKFQATFEKFSGFFVFFLFYFIHLFILFIYLFLLLFFIIMVKTSSQVLGPLRVPYLHHTGNSDRPQNSARVFWETKRKLTVQLPMRVEAHLRRSCKTRKITNPPHID